MKNLKDKKIFEARLIGYTLSLCLIVLMVYDYRLALQQNSTMVFIAYLFLALFFYGLLKFGDRRCWFKNKIKPKHYWLVILAIAGFFLFGSVRYENCRKELFYSKDSGLWIMKNKVDGYAVYYEDYYKSLHACSRLPRSYTH
ncbi:MAG: hypothetical protein AAB447_03565 [Patescibacteria group bacterium]